MIFFEIPDIYFGMNGRCWARAYVWGENESIPPGLKRLVPNYYFAFSCQVWYSIVAIPDLCTLITFIPHLAGEFIFILETHSILAKYKESHRIVICGDFNATLLPERSNPHDKMLKKFVQENDLVNTVAVPDHTFFSYRLGLISAGLHFHH